MDITRAQIAYDNMEPKEAADEYIQWHRRNLINAAATGCSMVYNSGSDARTYDAAERLFDEMAFSDIYKLISLSLQGDDLETGKQFRALVEKAIDSAVDYDIECFDCGEME